MTRYIEAFSWTGTIQRFLEDVVTESPLLNVCSGKTAWGDVTLDRYEPADTRASWTDLPFAGDAFGAVFADPPWDAEYKPQCAAFMREAMRVAPVCYLMAPWVYGAGWAKLTRVWLRQMPGVNRAVVLGRYERTVPLGMDLTTPSTAVGGEAKAEQEGGVQGSDFESSIK